MRDLFWFHVDVEDSTGKKGRVLAIASEEYLEDHFKTRSLTDENLKQWNIEVRDCIPKIGDDLFSLPVYFDVYATSVEGYFNALRFGQSDKTMPIAKRKIDLRGIEYDIEIFTAGKTRDSVDLFFSIFNEDERFGFVIGISGTLIASWGQYNRPREFIKNFIELALEKIKLEISKGNNTDGSTFIFTSDTVDVSLEKSIDKIKNEHYSMTNEGIRREILQQAFKVWEVDPHNYLFKDELLRKMPSTDPIAIERNLIYLEGKGVFDLVEKDNSGITAVKISSYGVDVMSDPKQFSLTTGPSINYSMTTINQGSGVAVIGDNNSLQNININSFFKELEQEINSSSELDDNSKRSLASLSTQLQETITQESPSPETVKTLMGKIGNIANWVNQKILSHPVIAQIVATLLTKGQQ